MSAILDYGAVTRAREANGEYHSITLDRLARALDGKLGELEVIWGPTKGRSGAFRREIARIRAEEIIPEPGPHIVASIDRAVNVQYRVIRDGELVSQQEFSSDDAHIFMEYTQPRNGKHDFRFEVSDGYPNLPGFGKVAPKINGYLPLGKTIIEYKIKEGIPALTLTTAKGSLKTEFVLSYQNLPEKTEEVIRL